MTKKKGSNPIRVSPKAWDQIFDHKVTLELSERKSIGMGKAIEDILKIKRLSEFAYWFELNSEKLGLKIDPYYLLGKSLCYPVEKKGEDFNVDNVVLVLRTSDLTRFHTEPPRPDLVVCLENDAKIDTPTIVVDLAEFEKKIPFPFYISKQLYAQMRKHPKFNWVKFLKETVKKEIKKLDEKGEK